MNASSKEAADSSTGTQQGNNTNDTNLISKGQSSSSSSPWLRLKDPRIVRVSRAFGGKDRHSKVCTIRGLRDRRVRLSVPTAIQLYDLQDRLGLNQPSKVVDWLLDAAKDEIDELPPLPFPPSGTFGLNHQMLLGTSQEQGLKTSSTSTSMEDPDAGELSRSSFWNSDDFWRAKCKEIARETTNQKDDDHHHGAQQQVVSSNHSSTPTMLSNNAASYGSYYHFEPPNFASSHSGTHGFASHTEELHNFNVVPLQLPLPSTLSLSSASQMLYPRQQVNHFQMLSSAAQTILPSSSLNPPPYSLSQSIRPFHLSITPMFPHPQNSNGGHPDNELRK